MPVETYIGTIQSLGSYSTVSAVEAAPSTVADGVAVEGTEIYWFVSSAGGAATATWQPWLYDTVASRWCKLGTTVSTTGNEVVLTYSAPAGSRIALQATALAAGPITRNLSYMDKDA